jgi:UDP-2-acetamido-2,6-beta-L-arabino-hexul-4-ose reductase
VLRSSLCSPSFRRLEVMTTVLITGADGFIGRNLAAHLKVRDDIVLREFNRRHTDAELRSWLSEADVVFHMAGVNRPERVEDFIHGNVGITKTLCQLLTELGRNPRVIFSSSVQAEADNPYGESKRQAEEVLLKCAASCGAVANIFRLKNVFGKWSRPNYNSVVATFCHNTAHGLPVQINDANHSLELIHVDDVVSAFVRQIDEPVDCNGGYAPADLIPSCKITLAELASRIQSFREMRSSLRTPDFSDRFNQQLYSTYLSYVDPADWEYGLDIKSDDRGNLAEFIKSPWFGQVFVSRTAPGITRGNHYHHIKTEKFFVVAGEGLVRFRRIGSDEIIEHRVRGEDYRVIDIPPGYTHSITNVGKSEMITLFWASEIFDPQRADTFFLSVDV